MPQRNPERWKSLFERSPSAMVIADIDRTIVDVNESFCRIFRYSMDEVQGLEVSGLYVEQAEFERLRHAILATPDADGVKFYATYRRKDGTMFSGQASLMQLKDNSDDLIGVAGIINDLSETVGSDVQTLLELERLSAEQARQNALYFRTPAMMHSINGQGFLETVSNAWLDRFGYREEEVLGKRSSDFLTAESRTFATEVVLPEFWRTGRCDRVPYTFVCKNGSHVEIELSAVLDRTQGPPVTLAVLEDVTDRNAARCALEQRNRDLKEFAHLVAHDLQTPMRHISGFSDVMRQDIAAGELGDLSSHLDVVEQSVGKLEAMIRSLLEFSVAGENALVLTDVDTNGLITEVSKLLSAEISRLGAMLDTPNLPAIHCDQSLMVRVFANLIGNSLKYVAPDVTPKISFSGHLDGVQTVLRIADNGIGIPEQSRDQVFEPLKRLHSTDSGYSGTGMGLALCKRIVEAHGGSIQAIEPDQPGTVIELKLPN